MDLKVKVKVKVTDNFSGEGPTDRRFAVEDLLFEFTAFTLALYQQRIQCFVLCLLTLYVCKRLQTCLQGWHSFELKQCRDKRIGAAKERHRPLRFEAGGKHNIFFRQCRLFSIK